MRGRVTAAMTILFGLSCACGPGSAVRASPTAPATTRVAATATAAPVPTSTATPTPRRPTPSPTPRVDEIPCADVEAVIERTRPARAALAGPEGPAPTTPPPDATPPPLGQYTLAESPLYPFTQGTGGSFLRTQQDILGPQPWGLSQELAVRNGLVWAYAQTFHPASGPGAFITYVHEFWSVGGALSFDEGAMRNACLYGGSVFEIPELSGATGQRFRNGSQYALRATFVKGKRRYTVMLTTTTLMPAEEIAYAARFAANVAR